jgi:hypothetical protein
MMFLGALYDYSKLPPVDALQAPPSPHRPGDDEEANHKPHSDTLELLDHVVSPQHCPTESLALWHAREGGAAGVFIPWNLEGKRGR